MKKTISIALTLLVITVVSFSQKSTTEKRLFAHTVGSYATNSSYRGPQGFAVQAGAGYKIYKGLTAIINYKHTRIGTIFQQVSLRPFDNSQSEFIQRFVGLSRSDWFDGKGSYHVETGDIFNFSLSYEFKLSNRVFLSPVVGYNIIRSEYTDISLRTAEFTNDVVTGGQIGYDIRHSNLAGINVGLMGGYKFKNGNSLFIDISRLEDANGDGFNHYESWTIGIGYRMMLR